MLVPALLGLLLSAATIGTASPLARIHVKFVQPPHFQEHGITTDGARLLEQQSYLSIGRQASPLSLSPAGNRLGSADTLVDRFPEPQSYEPLVENDVVLGTRESLHNTPDFSNGLDYPDPLLLTGEEAMLAVKYIYGRGELFFSDVPHERALLNNHGQRWLNGLDGNLLSSLRPGSPWYRPY